MKELMADLNVNKVLKIFQRYLCILAAFYVVGLYKFYRFSGTADYLYFAGEDRLIYLTILLLGSMLYFLFEIKRGSASKQ